ncbi:hypothetical protein Bhyg_11941 [Pseudolycoriella hygida]|uniref:Uncharacterized protein n=1 Tax=Pseudolycoriella hygida TaxID=35572 RepID=A0A9Q0MXP1_9DIPT|nr:hypothetical protein Bhyg_11941 [Pseudolycoriella hygida]
MVRVLLVTMDAVEFLKEFRAKHAGCYNEISNSKGDDVIHSESDELFGRVEDQATLYYDEDNTEETMPLVEPASHNITATLDLDEEVVSLNYTADTPTIIQSINGSEILLCDDSIESDSQQILDVEKLHSKPIEEEPKREMKKTDDVSNTTSKCSNEILFDGSVDNIESIVEFNQVKTDKTSDSFEINLDDIKMHSTSNTVSFDVVIGVDEEFGFAPITGPFAAVSKNSDDDDNESLVTIIEYDDAMDIDFEDKGSTPGDKVDDGRLEISSASKGREYFDEKWQRTEKTEILLFAN